MLYNADAVRRIKSAKRVVIYGARIIAEDVYMCLKSKPYECKVECFMVTNKQGNPDNVDGIPVISLAEGVDEYRDDLVIVAMIEKYIPEIKVILEENRFSNVLIFSFESDLWSGIRGNFVFDFFKDKDLPYQALEDALTDNSIDAFHLYTAKCHLDKPIADIDNSYDWEIPIQVGAALTDRCICEVTDNTGDNISFKNQHYCELTALYWIWKNDKSARYAGLGHYRRHFVLDRFMIKKILHSDVDVIVTIPIVNSCTVGERYRNDHVFADWELMLEAVNTLYPEYYEAALAVQDGYYYFAYNMFIARKDIFDAYCKWLFDILGYCEERVAPHEDVYQSRYAGFLSERLMTIFITHHKEYKVAIAQKHFIEKK